MLNRSSIAAMMLAALAVAATSAQAFDDAQYPNLKGQWSRLAVPGEVGPPPFDPSTRTRPTPSSLAR